MPGLPGWGVRAVGRVEALPDILGRGFQKSHRGKSDYPESLTISVPSTGDG